MAQNSENKPCDICPFTMLEKDDKKLLEAVKEIFTADQLAKAYIAAMKRNIELEKELGR